VANVEQVLAEHLVSWRQYGAVQQRCSEVISAQHARIVQLEAQLMRARAACIVQTSARAFARQDETRPASIGAWPVPWGLRQRVGAVAARVQRLLRHRASAPVKDLAPMPQDAAARALEDSLVAADLVICQTGCLSHGDYWRVQDHCRRTGKACVLVEQPDALRIVRLNRDGASATPQN
jgi:hypothetical protein